MFQANIKSKLRKIIQVRVSIFFLSALRMDLPVLSSEFLLSNFYITPDDEVRIARLGKKRGYSNSSHKQVILSSNLLCWPILLICTDYPIVTLKFKKLLL